MPLDGLRAWIAEVEHKLGMRTRVFLVLATIAIGGAGAAIYLAIDTRDEAVSKSDVQALQDELEGQAGGITSAGGEVAGLEAKLEALEAQVQALQGEEETPSGKSGDGSSPSPDSGGEEAPGHTGGATLPETEEHQEEGIEKAPGN